MKIIPEMSFKEWLRWRMTGLGCSDAIAIMGQGWVKPDVLWAQKTKKRIPDKANKYMRRGLDLEHLARREYQNITGISMPKMNVQSDRNHPMLASLDGYNLERRLPLEIKCPASEKPGNDHELALNGKIPEKYKWQLAHICAVTEDPECDYFSFDGKTGVILTYKRDIQRETLLIQAEKIFWQRILEDAWPDDGPESLKNLSYQEKLAKVHEFKRNLK